MLSELKIKAAKRAEKPYKLFDGDGMFLLVTPAGGKLWRLKYRFNGREKLLALGAYPEITLSEARERRFEARRLLAHGTDPGQEKKLAKAAQAGADCFSSVALAWHQHDKSKWTQKHAGRLLSRLENDVFPKIGNTPIAQLETPDLLAVLRPVEARSLETAHRIKIAFGQIYRFAIAEGYTRHDPTAALKGALRPQRKKHFATVVDPDGIGELLRHIDNYHGGAVVRIALQLLPLVFVRPGELRQAEWKEFDLDAGLWSIPAERMKMRQAHLVPLSRQAVQLLRLLHQLTGLGRHLFPSARGGGRCISDMAMNAALRSMGFDKTIITGHGFRAMARTVLDEVLGVRVEYIEHQLAHMVRDPLGRAYNRTTHLPQRTKMMQQWADHLDSLKA